ncbi:MAG: hypothetical protein AAFY72_03025 [Cyanobacteria bacterium J06649_4]
MKSTKAALGITGSLSTLLSVFLSVDSFSVQAQATIPNCTAAVNQMQTSLIEGRQLSIPNQFTRVSSDVYVDYPAGRSVLYTLFISGAASSSIMNSPQLLISVTESFLSECDTAGAVSIVDLDSIAGVETIGLVDGQPTFFECTEGIQATRIPWGYHDCSP